MARFSGHHRNATSVHVDDKLAADGRPSTPWIGLSTSVPVSDMNVEQAMTIAKLNYRVEVEPLHRVNHAGDFVSVPEHFAVVRQDTERVFATCKGQFAPWQNDEFFTFADSLVDEGLQLDAVGSWDHGAKVFLSAKLPEGITLNGSEEEAHDLYLLMTNAHDLTGAGTVSLTPVRIRCANMLNLAFHKGAKNRWTLKHTRTLGERLEFVRQSMNLSSAYMNEFKTQAEAMANTAMSLQEFDAFLNELVPAETSTGRDNRTNAGIRETYLTSDLLTPGNRWGALNAVSEYSEHLRGGRGNTETRFQSNLFGQTEALRNRATRMLTNW